MAAAMRMPLALVACMVTCGGRIQTVTAFSHSPAALGPRGFALPSELSSRPAPRLARTGAGLNMRSSSAFPEPSEDAEGDSWRQALNPEKGGPRPGWKTEADIYAAAVEEPAEVPRKEPEHFPWSQNWYPVALESVTSKAEPFHFVLLGHNIVIWWDHKKGAWGAMKDACPHRLAPLSEGRITEDGNIQCAYHGWEFSGTEGTCVKIPQAPAGQVMGVNSCGVSFFTTVKQGIIWVWGDPKPKDTSFYNAFTKMPSTKLIPTCEPLEREGVFSFETFRDVPYDYTFLLENILDPSHVPYTHHMTISRRHNARPMMFNVTSPATKKGFNATWAYVNDTGVEFRSTCFEAPVYMQHRYKSNKLDSWTVTYACPTTPGRSRLIARFPFVTNNSNLGFLFKILPTWYMHMKQNVILDDDAILLHLQERTVQRRLGGNIATGVPVDGGLSGSALGKSDRAYHLPTKADTPIVQLRKWIDMVTPITWSSGCDLSMPPALTREECLDRYHQHTKHCTACSGALRNIRAARPALAAAALFILATGKALLALALPEVGFGVQTAAPIVVAGLCAVLWRVLGEFEAGLTSGTYPPPRNLD